MNLSEIPSPLEQIRNKLSMKDVQLFEVMFDDDLKLAEKVKKLKFRSWQQYVAQRRILLKKIKDLNLK